MTMENKIRVLIVDDHVLFSRGIKSLLQRHPEFEVVDDVSDGLDGVKRAQTLRPDVVLLDPHMKGCPVVMPCASSASRFPKPTSSCSPSRRHRGPPRLPPERRLGLSVKNIETEARSMPLHRWPG